MFDIETIVRLEDSRKACHAGAADSPSKRLLDIGVAALALLLLAPLLVLVAIAVRLDSRGPALFRQRRTGLNARPFEILKFRSMRVQEDGDDVRQATRSDSRVTRVGAVIRALSIDELPQLINILRGDMSLVGPRPHALSHDELWARSVSGYARRFRARPGLTGFAQVKGLRGEVRTLDDVRARIDADNNYIDGWSFGLDLAIILRTVPLLFHDPQAY
jgi:lipopolysaccharide/colanic/teichoic acid biosynthesis glycosyltransferase